MAACNDNKLRVAFFLHTACSENGRKQVQSIRDTLNLIEKKNTVEYNYILIVHITHSEKYYVITTSK